MAGTPSIPEALWEAVREQAAGGWDTRKIADWLRDVHNLRVSHHAVARLLATLKEQERADTKAARQKAEEERQALRTQDERERLEVRGEVRQGLRGGLAKDIASLHLERRRVDKICRLLFEAICDDRNLDQVPNYVRAVEAKRRLIETKLKHAGSDPDDGRAEAAAAAREVESRLGAEPIPKGEDGLSPEDLPLGEGKAATSLPVEFLGPPPAVRSPGRLVHLAHPLRSRLGQEPRRRRVGPRSGRERYLQAPGAGRPHRR